MFNQKIFVSIACSLVIIASSGCATTMENKAIESDELQAIVEESSDLTSLISAGDKIKIFTKEKITISSREVTWVQLVVLDTTTSRIRGRVVNVCCDQWEQGEVANVTGDYEQEVADVTGDYAQETGLYKSIRPSQEVEDVTGNDVEVKLENVDRIEVRVEHLNLDPLVGEGAGMMVGGVVVHAAMYVLFFGLLIILL
jgi:hypothetical protein